MNPLTVTATTLRWLRPWEKLNASEFFKLCYYAQGAMLIVILVVDRHIDS